MFTILANTALPVTSWIVTYLINYVLHSLLFFGAIFLLLKVIGHHRSIALSETLYKACLVVPLFSALTFSLPMHVVSPINYAVTTIPAVTQEASVQPAIQVNATLPDQEIQLQPATQNTSTQDSSKTPMLQVPSQQIILFFVVLLWGAIAFLRLLSYLRSLLFIRKLYQHADSLPVSLFEKIKDVFPILSQKNIDIRVTDKTLIPMTFGKVIFFPEVMVQDETPAEQLQAILLHEYAHIERKDHLWLQIIKLLECFFFFNPAISYIRKQLFIISDLLSDTRTLQAGVALDPYLTLLMHLTESLTRHRQFTLPTHSFASKKSLLFQRIDFMLHAQKQPQLPIIFTAILVSVIGLSIVVASPAIQLGINNSADPSAQAAKNQVDEDPVKTAITTYLSQQSNLTSAYHGGKVFCDYQKFGEKEQPDGNQVYYLWVGCGEYYLGDGMVLAGSAASIPTVVTLKIDGETVQILSHEIPGDGSMYGPSIEKLFPKEIYSSKEFQDPYQDLELIRERMEQTALQYYEKTQSSPVSLVVVLCSWQFEGKWQYNAFCNGSTQTFRKYIFDNYIGAGIDGLKKQLANFPKGTKIFWGNPNNEIVDFACPPEEVMNELLQYAQNLGLDITAVCTHPVASSQSYVELDIFSGKPNPTWDLSFEDSEVFLDMLLKLKQTSKQTLFDGLGYKGFLVSITSPRSSSSVPSKYTVQNGLIDWKGMDFFYIDEGRKVEQWLLDKGKPYIDATLYEQVKKELIGNNTPQKNIVSSPTATKEKETTSDDSTKKLLVPSVTPTNDKVTSFSPPVKMNEVVVTQYYGQNNHLALDLASIGRLEIPIVASAEGIVKAAAYDSINGNYVIISHNNKYETLYAHNSKVVVKVGDSVKQGQAIAYMGTTGASTGIHLHFEICQPSCDESGTRLDPNKWFNE